MSPPGAGRVTSPGAQGLPTIEIACDESGSEGEKLIDGQTDVFAHASLQLDCETAAACIDEVRLGTRSPATECKASVVLRERNRRVLVWLLGPSGPLLGNGHVHLTEKCFRVVSTLIDLLADPEGLACGEGEASRQRTLSLERTLYREGARTFGPERWRRLLGAFNDVMRARYRVEAEVVAATFLHHVDALRADHPGSLAGDILGRLTRGRRSADDLVAHLLHTAHRDIVLDPQVTAVAAAVTFWGDTGSVLLVHDEQNALTAGRLSHLERLCRSAGGPMPSASGPSRLAGIRFVDSLSDPRVQVADLLAGAGRKIASDALNDRGDEELTGLLRLYVDSHSVWGDDTTWSRLGPLGRGL